MNTNPLLSILITVYNREKYIAEAIESVLSSTYQNWELIIVDDRSTDSSVAISKSFEAKDERIKLYVNEKNLGDYPNRNKAASYAQGKYIKYLDADDTIYKYSLDYMVEAMEAHPKAALGISFNKIEDVKPYPILSSPKKTFFDEFLGKSILGCGPSAAIIKREVFQEIGGFSGTQYIGDHELWLKFGAQFSVVKLQPSLVWWRQHDEQQIVSERKNYNTINIRYQLSLNTLYSNKHLFEENKYIKAIKKLKQNHARLLLRFVLIKRDFKVFRSLYKASKLSFIELFRGFKGYI